MFVGIAFGYHRLELASSILFRSFSQAM